MTTLALAWVSLAALGCSESSGPQAASVTPGMRFLKGADKSDTIGAVESELLQLSVGDEKGRPVAGATVVFTSMLLTEVGGVGPVLVSHSTANTFGTVYFDSTGTDGTVSVRVKMGDVAGKGALIVNVPSFQLTDTAEYTILPGTAARFTLLPEDTAVAVGKTLTLRATVTDRMGNARNDQLSYRVSGTGATVAAGGVVSAAQPARVAVIATLPAVPGAEDTTLVSAVPDFTVAARWANKLRTLQLDGSNVRDIQTSFLVVEPGPRWLPDGQSLIVTGKTLVNELTYLYKVGVDGTITSLLPQQSATAGIGAIRGFDSAPDGRFIYFIGNNCNFNGIMYRLPVGSTEFERLSPPPGPFPDECFNTVFNWPSVSPNGTQIAYENAATSSSGFNIRLLDVAARTVRILNVVGQQPRWSPVGDLVAYGASDRIWTMNSDGTGARAITPANRIYVPGVSWSRDGQWIVARYQPSTTNASLTTVLINVASGLELPLAYFGFPNNYSVPDFRPN